MALPRKLPEIIQPADFHALIRARRGRGAAAQRDRLIMHTMYRCGLRIGEIVALRPHHLLATHTIRIRDSKGGSDRDVPWPDDLDALITAWTSRRSTMMHHHIDPAPDIDFYFCHVGTTAGEQLHVRGLEAMVQRARRSAGLHYHCTPHTFRHTCATNWLADGFTLAEVRDLLGHANIATTSMYLHTTPKQLHDKIRAPRLTPAEQLRLTLTPEQLNLLHALGDDRR